MKRMIIFVGLVVGSLVYAQSFEHVENYILGCKAECKRNFNTECMVSGISSASFYYHNTEDEGRKLMKGMIEILGEYCPKTTWRYKKTFKIK